jgi:hypothetical protein
VADATPLRKFGESQSEEEEQKHGIKVNLGLEGPLAAAQVKAGGGHARVRAASQREIPLPRQVSCLYTLGDGLRSRRFKP